MWGVPVVGQSSSSQKGSTELLLPGDRAGRKEQILLNTFYTTKKSEIILDRLQTFLYFFAE